MSEVWKDIEEYEGLYQVSNYGRIRSFDRWVIGKSNSKRFKKGKILKTVEHNGYQHIFLYKNGKGKWFYVHRLVAQAFIPNPDNLTEVNHINEIKNDNRVVNLEWCDRKYNVNYGTVKQRIADTKINGKRSKTVYQYTLDGELVAEYPSTMEIERQLGYYNNNISACCLGKLKTAYGYIWSYN